MLEHGMHTSQMSRYLWYAPSSKEGKEKTTLSSMIEEKLMVDQSFTLVQVRNKQPHSVVTCTMQTMKYVKRLIYVLCVLQFCMQVQSLCTAHAYCQKHPLEAPPPSQLVRLWSSIAPQQRKNRG